MADNVGYTPGAGAIVAADEIAGVLHQRVKVSVGADGSATDLNSGQATMANSLPVAIASDQSDVPITLAGEAVALVGEQENTAVATDPILVAGRYDITPRALGGGDAGAIAISASGEVLANLGSNVVTVDATGQGDVPITLAGEIVTVDATTSGDVPITLAGEVVSVSNAGTFATQATQAGTWTVNLGAVDNAVLDTIAANTAPLLTSITVDATTSGDVPITLAGESVTVTGTGTFAVQAAQTGTWNVNAAQSGAWTVNLGSTDNTVLDNIATNTGNTNSNITNVQPRELRSNGGSAGGLDVYRSLDLDESSELVSSGSITIHHVWVTNVSDNTRWIKFYDNSAPTVGSDTPVITFGIPGNTSQDITGNLGIGDIGCYFNNALSIAATTGVADSDTGAPATNDVVINVFYSTS